MLQTRIEALFEQKAGGYSPADRGVFEEFKAALNSGEARAAEPDAASPTGWRVNVWVKKGILLGFRMGSIVDMSVDGERMPFFDKDTYPLRKLPQGQGLRVVPGGSSIRDGCYIGASVTCMPPMFINAGAYVGEGTLIDSHVLIGSCAQIGKQCHISAGVQIGGVLEPVGELPVIVEDEVLIGGNSGVYEGTVVRKRAVLGTGTILNRSTPVYDLVRKQVHAAGENEPLVIPEQAVVVSGSRAITHGAGKEWNLSLYTPVIVKYRDARTESRIRLEELLR
ncbi:MAG TPA: 2,3,4,5-tetrahydropyridine-2,6-dicarboxylate N-succinyltransferase [Methylomirabilota bacterium]|nr:2,3,4,5-tetrahydropyridine-2,6-dicarboxylate N-succinyltransferase [Methylomirabilota bacterium]